MGRLTQNLRTKHDRDRLAFVVNSVSVFVLLLIFINHAFIEDYHFSVDLRFSSLTVCMAVNHFLTDLRVLSDRLTTIDWQYYHSLSLRNSHNHCNRMFAKEPSHAPALGLNPAGPIAGLPEHHPRDRTPSNLDPLIFPNTGAAPFKVMSDINNETTRQQTQ